MLECFVVGLLCLPMPSNYVRKTVVGLLVNVWKKQQPVRFMAGLMFAVNLWYFYEAWSYKGYSGEYSEHDAIKKTREQRNFYLTGAGLFLYVILYRLIEIHSQLHDAREAQKGEKKAVEDGMPFIKKTKEGEKMWVFF